MLWWFHLLQRHCVCAAASTCCSTIEPSLYVHLLQHHCICSAAPNASSATAYDLLLPLAAAPLHRACCPNLRWHLLCCFHLLHHHLLFYVSRHHRCICSTASTCFHLLQHHYICPAACTTCSTTVLALMVVPSAAPL